MGYMLVVSIALDDTDAVVYRAVIQNDEFKVLIGLIQNTIYALCKKCRVVIVWDNNTDFWTICYGIYSCLIYNNSLFSKAFTYKQDKGIFLLTNV